jgi:hypothetical protein
MVTRKDIDELMSDRPFKFSPEEVDYRKSPSGSAMICAACFHLYRRAIDNHTVCELIRSDEIDRDGIDPSYRCDFYTCDGDVTPLRSERN